VLAIVNLHCRLVGIRLDADAGAGAGAGADDDDYAIGGLGSGLGRQSNCSINRGYVKKISKILNRIGFEHELEVKPHRDINIYKIDIANVEEKICVEYDGRNHYYRDSGREKLKSVNKKIFLERLGWKVICIRYYDDDVNNKKFGGENSKDRFIVEKFLRKKLEDVGWMGSK
jgi:very-short-patch-repair endonuclease